MLKPLEMLMKATRFKLVAPQDVSNFASESKENLQVYQAQYQAALQYLCEIKQLKREMEILAFFLRQKKHSIQCEIFSEMNLEEKEQETPVEKRVLLISILNEHQLPVDAIKKPVECLSQTKCFQVELLHFLFSFLFARFPLESPLFFRSDHDLYSTAKQDYDHRKQIDTSLCTNEQLSLLTGIENQYGDPRQGMDVGEASNHILVYPLIKMAEGYSFNDLLLLMPYVLQYYRQKFGYLSEQFLLKERQKLETEAASSESSLQKSSDYPTNELSL